MHIAMLRMQCAQRRRAPGPRAVMASPAALPYDIAAPFLETGALEVPRLAQLFARSLAAGLLLVLGLQGRASAAADDLAPRLAELARQAVAEDDVSGIVIAVGYKDEAPAIAAAGLAEMAAHVAMRPESDFKAASIAKSFLAALTLTLADEGKLALDDKLARFLPDVPNAGRVSLRQLLDHTSGYDDYITDAFIAAARAQPEKRWTPRELLAFAHPERLDFTPGKRFDYSNTNYLLLRMALAAVLGHSPLAEMRQRFLAPLGLTRTWFAEEEAVPAGALAHGYSDLADSGGLEDATAEPAELGGDDGALVSNAPDLMAWARALLGGRVLSEARLGEMLSFVGTDGADSVPGSGYGLGIERFRYAGVMLYGHTGSAPGYNVAMLYEPASETALVVALNEDPPDEALLDIIAERVVRAVEDMGKAHFPRGPDADAPPAP